MGVGQRSPESPLLGFRSAARGKSLVCGRRIEWVRVLATRDLVGLDSRGAVLGTSAISGELGRRGRSVFRNGRSALPSDGAALRLKETMLPNDRTVLGNDGLMLWKNEMVLTKLGTVVASFRSILRKHGTVVPSFRSSVPKLGMVVRNDETVLPNVGTLLPKR